MKKIILFLALIMPAVVLAQNEANAKLSKYEQFTSKTGKIYKYVDVKLPSIRVKYGDALRTTVRTLLGEQNNTYFYIVDNPGESRSSSYKAMIEYSDLVNINIALKRLISEVKGDREANPDYLENKFVGEDGFQIGYYVSEGDVLWFMLLCSYSNSMVFIDDAESLAYDFNAAQIEIENLKLKYGK